MNFHAIYFVYFPFFVFEKEKERERNVAFYRSLIIVLNEIKWTVKPNSNSLFTLNVPVLTIRL